jgi:hypothetical protein
MHGLLRSTEFWRRTGLIYCSYQVTHLRAAALRAAGRPAAEVQRRVWEPQLACLGRGGDAAAVRRPQGAVHQGAPGWVGLFGGFDFSSCFAMQMPSSLAVLSWGNSSQQAATHVTNQPQAGQFLGARPDIVPRQICHRLRVLQDSAPLLPAGNVAAILRGELGVADLTEVFEWIDLHHPLGSASVGQVHKARLRRFTAGQLRRHRGGGDGDGETGGGDMRGGGNGGKLRIGLGKLWGVCRHVCGSPAALHRRLQRGRSFATGSSSDGDDEPPVAGPAAAAAARAVAAGWTPRDGLVAVKVQHPGAMEIMMEDLGEAV